MKIDKEILEKTSYCKSNFVCLNDDKHNYCKVKKMVADEFPFMECLESIYCPYKMDFKFADICTCPTRKELFNKYGI